MRFQSTDIPGVVIIELDAHVDDRGFFARTYCPHEFANAGYPFVPMQTSLSRNYSAHTLRGMHYQVPPYGESKLVRVVSGRVHDVALDLRLGSPTYLRWTATELSAANGRAILIPAGVAHGFMTLEPDTDILYQIDRAYEPGHGQAVRWNDPAFAIEWPAVPAVISATDAALPDFVPGVMN